MPSSGPRYPGTAASLANAGTSENANAWTTPANVGADDATEASITAATYDSPDISEILVASNFGFTIPAGATIDGITVEIDRRSIIASSGKDFRVQLATGTTFADLVGTNKADTPTIWPSTTAVATYGGAADTWTAGLTAAQVNATGFAVFLSAQANIANADIGVDFIRVTITYTEGPITISPSAIASAEAIGSLVHTVPLSEIWTSNLETGDLTEWSSTQIATDGVIEAIAGARKNGAYGLHVFEIAASTGGVYIRKNISAVDEIFVSGYFRQDTDGAAGNNNAWLRIFSGTQRLFDIYRQNSDGGIWLRVTSTGPTTYVFHQLLANGQPIDTWYFIEVYAKYNGAGAVSTITAWVDGVQKYTASNETIYAGQFDNVRTGAEHPSQYVDTWSDDFAVMVPAPTGPASATISPSAIGSGAAFGSHTLASGSVAIAPSSIGSAETVGSHTLRGNNSITLTGISSGEAGGTAVVLHGGVLITPPATASAEALGTHILAARSTLLPTAIAAPGGIGSTTVGADDFIGGGSGVLEGTNPDTGDWIKLVASSATLNSDSAGNCTPSGPTDSTAREIHYSIASAVGDSEAVVTASAVGSFSGGVGIDAVGPSVRGSVSGNAYSYVATWDGAAVAIYRWTNGVATLIASFSKGSLVGKQVAVRIHASGSGPTTLKARGWDSTGAEPSTWDIETTNNTAGNDVATGTVGLIGVHFDDGITNSGSFYSNFSAVSLSISSALGNPTLVNQPAGLTINPTAITSLESIGSHTLLSGNVTVAPSSISSAEGIGSPVLIPSAVTILPTGISSSEVFGNPVLRATSAILHNSIPSGESLGIPTILPGMATIVLTGISSAESLGNPILAQAGGPSLIAPSGISSAAALGSPSLLPGNTNIAPVGVITGEASGSQSVLPGPVSISPTSIESGAALGTPTITVGQVVIVPQGVGTGEATGTPTLQATASIQVSGITTSELLGLPILVVADTSVSVIPAGITSAELLGSPQFIPGAISVIPVAISSSELLGNHVLRNSRSSWRWVNSSPAMAGVRTAERPVLQDGFARTRKNEGENG